MSPILIFVIAFIVFWMLVGLYQKNTNAVCKSKKMLHGKTALVTGGTSGMGLQIAIDFAHRGARVIVACPFEEEGVSAREKIVKSSGNDQVVFKLLDLGSLDSVRNFAADIIQKEERLDILMNNAGIGQQVHRLTKDGLNFVLQVNYFGHFLLTLLLLPLLKKSGTADDPSRIVNTASVLHWIGHIDIDNLNCIGQHFPIRMYGTSKLCMLLFARELTKRLKGSNLVIHSVDPGAVGTPIFVNSCKTIHMSLFGSFVAFIFGVLFKHPWEGIQPALHAALSRGPGTVSGKLYKNCKEIRGASSAHDDKTAKKLWEESLRLVRLTDDEFNTCLM